MLASQEFERFIFPDEIAEDDKKKEKFFLAKNKKDIAFKGKSSVSDRISRMCLLGVFEEDK